MKTEKHFSAISSSALALMEKLSKVPSSANYVRKLDSIVTEASDAVADYLLDGQIEDSDTRYQDLREKFVRVVGTLQEGAWIMYPALGLSNNFNATASGDMGDLEPDGVEPWGIVSKNDANDGGKAATLGPNDAQGGRAGVDPLVTSALRAESAEKFVAGILNEMSTCENCGCDKFNSQGECMECSM